MAFGSEFNSNGLSDTFCCTCNDGIHFLLGWFNSDEKLWSTGIITQTGDKQFGVQKVNKKIYFCGRRKATGSEVPGRASQKEKDAIA